MAILVHVALRACFHPGSISRMQGTSLRPDGQAKLPNPALARGYHVFTQLLTRLSVTLSQAKFQNRDKPKPRGGLKEGFRLGPGCSDKHLGPADTRSRERRGRRRLWPQQSRHSDQVSEMFLLGCLITDR